MNTKINTIIKAIEYKRYNVRVMIRAGTHKIEVSDIIIFMYSIQPSMHKTDTHNLFFKKNDQNTF